MAARLARPEKLLGQFLHHLEHAGQARITQYTRYLTVGLALLQSTGYVELARSGTLFNGCGAAGNNPLIPNASVFTIATMVITMVAGTTVIMWMGELITDRGVGNGMSILIFTQVVARFPSSLWSVAKSKGWWVFAIVVAIGFVLLGAGAWWEAKNFVAPGPAAQETIVIINPRTKKIVWEYGHLGRPGTAPGYLNTPDGFDLLLPDGSTPTPLGDFDIARFEGAVAADGRFKSEFDWAK